MRLSIPITLLLGLTVLFMIRKDELKISHAVLVVLLGFYLSSTALSGRIGQIDTMIAGLLGGSLGPQ